MWIYGVAIESNFVSLFQIENGPLHVLVLGLGTELAIQMPEIETFGSS
jgi:hypothetical protein